MKFENHCKESERLFGKRFEDVHRWLDAYAGSPQHGMRHRKVRHHEEGVRQIERMYGHFAAQAAKQHIISDLMEEGWTYTDPFPLNEDDYVRFGFF